MFQQRIVELGECDDSTLLSEYIITLQAEISELMELFRGKHTSKIKKIIYIPMDIVHALDYLGYLISDNINSNADSIRNIMNALDYDTGATDLDKNQLSYYKKLINHFKKDVENAKPT